MNDVLSKMEVIFEDMELFYSLNENGEAARSKFDGPALKTVLNNLMTHGLQVLF